MKELERDLDGAFQLYIKAAQTFLHLASLAPDKVSKERCIAAGNRALERAERIKAVKGDTLKPVIRDRFSEGEPRSKHFPFLDTYPRCTASLILRGATSRSGEILKGQLPSIPEMGSRCNIVYEFRRSHAISVRVFHFSQPLVLMLT